jgi:hypothetical protein
MRTCADLKGTISALVPLYASTRWHFMVQGTVGMKSENAQLRTQLRGEGAPAVKRELIFACGLEHNFYL